MSTPSTLQVCQTVLDRVLDALVAAGSDPIQTAYPAAGIVAWDDCCGQLTVAPERNYRSVSFPEEATGNENCFPGFRAFQLVVILVRCVPVPEDEDTLPDPADLAAAYGAFIDDAEVVWDAVQQPFPETWERANLSQTFVGANGGCVGVETRVTIGIEDF